MTEQPKEVILSLFDYSTVMVQPWAEAGYLCYCVDWQHSPGKTRMGNIIKWGVDIRTWIPPIKQYKIVFAFPPCTHLAISGARWFQGKGLRKLAESIVLVAKSTEICDWAKAPYLIENPIGKLSTYWRKPDYIFDPCNFAGYGDDTDLYTKATCLWVGGGLKFPEYKNGYPSLGSRIRDTLSSGNERSQTPIGFARAIYEANK